MLACELLPDVCSAQRQALFVERDVVDLGSTADGSFRRTARDGNCWPTASCRTTCICWLKPDVNLPMRSHSSIRPSSDLDMLSRVRMARKLWQPSFYDRILRHDEATLSVVQYVLRIQFEQVS